MIRNFTDHAANERTFLAWVRTATAIVGFGLVAARVGQDGPPLPTMLLLLGTGGAIVVLAYARLRALRRRIDASELVEADSPGGDVLLAALVVAMLTLFGAFALHVGNTRAGVPPDGTRGERSVVVDTIP